MCGGCSNPSPPAFEPTATVREIMSAIVDPSADVLWDAVEVEATLAGTRKKAPATEEEWNLLGRHAIALVETSNLLLIPGRRVANPGDKAEDPRVDRNPEEIQLLMTQDPASWVAARARVARRRDGVARRHPGQGRAAAAECRRRAGQGVRNLPRQ